MGKTISRIRAKVVDEIEWCQALIDGINKSDEPLTARQEKRLDKAISRQYAMRYALDIIDKESESAMNPSVNIEPVTTPGVTMVRLACKNDFGKDGDK